ncbi:P-loop containing nucleoside triphosphate hydrolase protein [Lentinula edodes]|uniref:P-loop containing nucleoside triphosphate hydrolase protein n=1 Tax=Lentinula edodes TaxID=5353 RepID=UPI001E8E5810|nr:P-loop containing nucleoside triphosphate hydrolase protein [Lentinula edodes]KAH7868898.1 P-loop containing nucleoside triphosphate hydrolase protein [Lentinula edodes]
MSTLWLNLRSQLSNGIASLLSFLSKAYIVDSAKLMVIGLIVEASRRLCQWLFVRFRIRYSITAQFNQGDPAYEWILHFLNDQEVWRRAYDFQVSAKSSTRKWGISSPVTGESSIVKSESVEYVPTYSQPQLFRWRGYWLEIMRSKPQNEISFILPHPQSSGFESIFISVYTLDMSVLSAIIEEARQRYVEVTRPDVIIHLADNDMLHLHHTTWGSVKRQLRRPFNSVILQEGVLDSLRQDAKEFMETESWYTERGIPHRRGYLLYGPPGSGKSSTIYALAGELGMEIYSLSLASNFVDDSFLQRATSSIPKNSIFLIEDIDCALPSMEDTDQDQSNIINVARRRIWRSVTVTLSTLLNVIDGVGSEQGRLFFTTTNHIDHLDPALLRPGRIDRKIPYHLATKEQAAALFTSFFSPDCISELIETGALTGKIEGNHDVQSITNLSKSFASQVPSHEFSVAELQGYLLGYKKQAEEAAVGVAAWIEQERKYKREEEEKANERTRRSKEQQEKMVGNDHAAIGRGVSLGSLGPPQSLRT